MAKIQEVLPEESSSTDQPLEQVQNHDENNVFATERRHSEQPESINDTYVLEKDDSNVTPDSSNICNNDNQVDQNVAECVDERDALANLIANLTLDTEENKTILKQLKKANASLTQELKECRTNLELRTGRSTFANPKYLKIAQSEKPCLYEIPYDTSDHANRFCPNREETVTLEKESRSKLNKDTVKPMITHIKTDLYEIFKPPCQKPILISWNGLKKLGRQCGEKLTLQNLPQSRKQAEIHSNVLKLGMHRIATSIKQNRGLQLPHASRNTSPHVSKSTGVTHPTSVSRPQLKSYQKPKSYFKELYENTNKAWKWWIEKKCPSEYKWTQTTPSRPNLKWKPTGRIFSNVRFRWIPTGKLFNSCTGKVESEPTHGSNVDIPHIHACKQTLGLSAGTSFNGQKQQRIDLNADALYNAKQENLRVWLQKMLISKKPVPEWFHKR
ncbi:hypothetical protein Tco_0103427 [Tanacetum coccineum]